MAILSDIGRLISSSLNIDEVYESFATQVQKLIPTDRLSIDLNNPDKQTFTVAYVSGYDIPGRRPGDIVPTAGTITENIRVTRTGMLIHTMGVEDITGRLPNVTNVATVLARMRSLMSVPLISRDEVIGALHFRSKRTNAYTEKDLQLAERIGTQIAAVIANARLYSSLQESEKFLRMSEGRYRTLFNKARDGILLVNRKTGELLDCNQALCDMVERTKKELIGQAQSILNPQQVPVDGQSLGFRVHGSGNPGFVGEDILLSKNEKQIPVEISAARTSIGGQDCLMAIVRDITERKLVSDALRQSHDELELRVADRTKDLTRVNEELLTAITEHKRARDEMAILADIGRVIGSTLEIDKVYERVAGEIRKMILFDSLVVNLFSAQQETLDIAYASGLDIPGRKMGDVFPAQGTLAEETVRTREGVIVQSENPNELADKFPSLIVSFRAGIRSVMSVPLIARDEVIGNLIIRSKKPVAYSEHDLRLAEKIGMQIAGAIANARLFGERKRAEEELQKTLESLRKAFGTTVQVMVSAVETRDPYTAGHQTRSADLARAIATNMGLAQEKIDAIRMAGTIHDIGKLSIPAEILSKPTKLSEIEFMLIKEHARQGYEILKNVEPPWPLAEIIYHHHERMDGSGYPRNLKGDAILIESRILAVSDVVEAMASHRPYRPGFGIQAALNEIENNRGTLYDEPAADACLRLFREKGFQLAEA